jgi:hypothetical protein
MDAPLFVKGGTPVVFGGGDGVIGVRVWMPPARRAASRLDGALPSTTSVEEEVAPTWAHVYDDDGETTR